jgi:hypothetical protein
MAVNRFDNIAEYNPLNTYVSPPFQEIALALGSRQKQADAQLDDIYSRSNSLNLPTISEHEPSRQQFVYAIT